MSKNKIPIIIILYNRPKHAQKLFQSITTGKNFSKYDFYVFCDGPRNKEDVKKIKKIKTLIKQLHKEAFYGSEVDVLKISELGNKLNKMLN